MIETEIPEWRIVDDATWFAVHQRFSAPQPEAEVTTQPRAKYPLTGLAGCGQCGGAIASHRVRTFGGGADRVMAHCCARHRDRGNAVCSVSVYASFRFTLPRARARAIQEPARLRQRSRSGSIGRDADAPDIPTASYRRRSATWTAIPYVSHLLPVSDLALEDGADEDEAVAALLHDAAEGQGGLATIETIRRRSGNRVADIVAACSDSPAISAAAGGAVAARSPRVR